MMTATGLATGIIIGSSLEHSGHSWKSAVGMILACAILGAALALYIWFTNR